MVSKFLHACTCDVDCVFAWFMFYASHLYIYMYTCVCERWKCYNRHQNAHSDSTGPSRWMRGLKFTAREGASQNSLARRQGFSGWFLEAQPRLSGGNTSFISFMSFPWVSRDLKRSQESSHLGLRGGEPAEEGDLDLVDRVAYRSSRCLDPKCQESEWDGRMGRNVQWAHFLFGSLWLVCLHSAWGGEEEGHDWHDWHDWHECWSTAMQIGFLGHCFQPKMSVSSYLILFILCSQGLQESVCVRVYFGILQDDGSVEQTEWTWTNQLEVGLKQSLSVLERVSKVFRRLASLG